LKCNETRARRISALSRQSGAVLTIFLRWYCHLLSWNLRQAAISRRSGIGIAWPRLEYLTNPRTPNTSSTNFLRSSSGEVGPTRRRNHGSHVCHSAGLPRRAIPHSPLRRRPTAVLFYPQRRCLDPTRQQTVGTGAVVPNPPAKPTPSRYRATATLPSLVGPPATRKYIKRTSHRVRSHRGQPSRVAWH
jgi:hypothetical protein